MTGSVKAIEKRSVRQNAFLTLFEIFMVVVAVIFIYPCLYVIMCAFKPEAAISLHPMSMPSSFYVQNFVTAWDRMNVPVTLFNTFYITCLGLVGIVLFAAMAAYMLARTDSILSRILYLVFAFALVIPFQVIMIPLVVLVSDLKLNSVWGIIVPYWGLGIPMAVFMYHGFVKGVPKELEESAAIDGAGRFYTYFKIVFPMLKPITATVAVLDALWLWNDFLFPLITLKGGATLTLAQMSFNSQFQKEYGALCASLVLTALPIIIFYLFLQKYIIKGISAGAVKG